jgi:hypothetical protein
VNLKVNQYEYTSNKIPAKMFRNKNITKNEIF